MPSISKIPLLQVAVLLLETSSAFKVDFWLGPHCTSSAVGTFEQSRGDFEHDGQVIAPCNSVPGDAQSATVESQNDDSSLANVEFFSSSNCDLSTRIASTDAGCIGFTGTNGNAQSWQLSTDLANPGKKRRTSKRGLGIPEVPRSTASRWWSKQQDDLRAELGLSAENATGSLSPIWDPMAHVEAGFGHGNVTERWGRVWKWQQVALGMSIGIPLEEWDDAIHQFSDEFMIYGDEDYEFALLEKRSCGAVGCSLASRDILDKRWDYAQCRSVLDCGRRFTSAAVVNIGNGWGQAVRAGYKLKTYGSTFYDFVHRHPFSVGFATAGASTVTGYALGYTHGGATAQDNQQLQSCGGGSNQVNAFIQSLVDAADAGSNSAGEVNITLPNGHILTISAEVYPQGQRPGVDQCGVKRPSV